MADYLNVLEKLEQDESVKHEYFLEHQSYNNSYENSDEIRIEVKNREKFTVPSQSYLQIEGKINKPDGLLGTAVFGQNGLMYLFDEIRYEINSKEVDKVKNVGLTTTIKGLCSFTPEDIVSLHPAGWKHPDRDAPVGMSDEFVAQYPMSACMGFFERFTRALVNCTQTLILIRTNTDCSAVNVVLTSEEKEALKTAPEKAVKNEKLRKQISVNITKIKWVLKYFVPSIKTELGLMRILDGKKWLPLQFQHWDLAVYPMVPQTTRHTWSIKTFSNMEKPRIILIGMQHTPQSSGYEAEKFLHCSLRNLKVHLNAEEYPYENQNANFNAGKFASFYRTYSQFQSIYYDCDGMSHPLLSMNTYKNHGPIIVVDCTKQNDAVKSSTVDLRIDFETIDNFPDKTSIYCVVIHDCAMEYNAFSGELRKL